ncbi:MAG: hypothetical protein ABSF22_11085 [Bryobacteraceae bacterium]
MNPLGQVYLKTNNGEYAQVMCNQDYSAIVVLPGSGVPAASAGLFTLYATGSNAQVALGINSCGVGQVFASDRHGDWYGKLQVQAPFSADWITQAQGDEIYMLFPLPSATGGQKGLALLNPLYQAFVSVRYDEQDNRAGNGYPLRTRMGPLFGSDQGTPITAVGAWETMQLEFADSSSAARLVLQAAWNNSQISRFPGYNDYTGCDFNNFDFSNMNLASYSFQSANLDYADFTHAASIQGMDITGASTTGTKFGNQNLASVVGA